MKVYLDIPCCWRLGRCDLRPAQRALPRPPVVALVGLLGILLGEQIPPLIKHLYHDTPASVSWLKQIKPHVFGRLPVAHSAGGESVRTGMRAVRIFDEHEHRTGSDLT